MLELRPEMNGMNGRCDFLSAASSKPRSGAVAFESVGGCCVKLVSLNVGRPRLVVYKGTTINTGIFKKPVLGPIQLRALNLDGDRQADLSVHGGPNKAVYAYPAEHYPHWRRELPGLNLPWGIFGENFTTSGMAEDNLHIGDRFQMGSAI